MKGAPFPKAAFKDHGGPHGTDFSIKESAEDKAKRDLDIMKDGSRFDESGKRKKGEARKIAKMTREFTGLDQQKYDRQTKRAKKSFRGEGGQKGLDKLKRKLQKKASRKSARKGLVGKVKKVVEKVNPFDAKSKDAREARKIARGNKNKGKGGKHGQGCKDGKCDQGGIKGK